MKNKIIKIKYLFIGLFIFLLCLTPFHWGYFFAKSFIDPELIVIYEDPIVWDLATAPIVIDQKDLYFKKGLKIKEGVRILFKNDARLIVEGDFEVSGNTEHPVIFEGSEEGEENFSIVISDADKIYINTAIFKKGGYFGCRANNFQKSIFKKAFAKDSCKPTGALNVISSNETTINNTIFTENYRAINIFQSQNVLLTNNSFYHNEEIAVYSEAENSIISKSNCWMRPSGPTYENWPNGRGEKIIGNFSISFPRECGSEFKPIILVPGFGGSWNWEVMLRNWVFSNNWDFPPFFHGYDGWTDSLEDLGYRKNRDYFVVYYDWRKDNHQNLEDFLLPTLEKIKKTSFDENYDMIAHSMGGFMTLDYLTGEDYENNIDKVILQGSPLLGANKAYSVWSGGIIPNDWAVMEQYLSFLSRKEENKGLDNYDLIHKYIPSAKQLLPLYNYLENKNGETINVWEMKEQNDYLMELLYQVSENKNKFDFADNLLMIQGTGKSTSKTINVEDYDGENSDKLWKDGKIVSEEKTDLGDGTVLNESSSSVPFFKTVTLENVKHVDLPAKAVKTTNEFLGLKILDKEYPETIKDKLLFIFACPIDVEVTDSDGNSVNKNESKIKNSYYYSDGQDDGYKIIEIQNPSGKYDLKITGNGEGTYDGWIYKTSEEENIFTEFNGEVTDGDEIAYEVAFNNISVDLDKVSTTTTEGNSVHYSVHEDVHEDKDDEEGDEKKNKGGVSVASASSERDIFGNEIAISQNSSKEKLVDYSSEQENDKSINNPIVAGEQAGKSIRFRVATLMILIGVTLLTITWTVKRKNSKV